MNRQLEELVWERARNRCEYCQVFAETSLLPFQIDHVIAQKHHGMTNSENLALSCERCNSHKGPNVGGYRDGEFVRLFHPRNDDWAGHFKWHGGTLVGKTDIGQVTIDVLAINLPYRVAVREALIAEGVFPPGQER